MDTSSLILFMYDVYPALHNILQSYSFLCVCFCMCVCVVCVYGCLCCLWYVCILVIRMLCCVYMCGMCVCMWCVLYVLYCVSIWIQCGVYVWCIPMCKDGCLPLLLSVMRVR